MPYKRNIFWHMEAIHRCLPSFEADARMNFHNLTLYVGARNRYHFMQPQFIVWINGHPAYSPTIGPGTRGGFIGWLPYFNKRWPAGSGKLAFKDLCLAQDIPTPRMWRSAAEADRPYVVKPFNASFGMGLRGPFHPGASSPTALFGGEQAYAEEFVAGRIAKIWFWDAKPACLEIAEMPTVTGNGVDTFAQLVARSTVPGTPPIDADYLRAIARFQSSDLDAVPPPGTTLMAEIRYGSGLAQPSMENANLLQRHAHDVLGQQLLRYGPLFWNSIPAEFRQNTLYTVDAIIDAQNQFWFLEMNCNPSSHPDVYPLMFEGLFGAPGIPVPEAPNSASNSDQFRQNLMTFRPQQGIPDYSRQLPPPGSPPQYRRGPVSGA